GGFKHPNRNLPALGRNDSKPYINAEDCCEEQIIVSVTCLVRIPLHNSTKQINMKFFLAFVATLACAVASPSAYGSYAPAPYYGGYYGYSAYAHSPPADIKVLPNGYLADTPEVSHAKAAHEVAKGYVAAAAAANPDYDSYSHAPAYYGKSYYSAPAYYAAPYAAPYAAYAAPSYGYAKHY
ncbi:hypothetical protein WDU94_007960, partial [Cyamophila willieti]